MPLYQVECEVTITLPVVAKDIHEATSLARKNVEYEFDINGPDLKDGYFTASEVKSYDDIPEDWPGSSAYSSQGQIEITEELFEEFDSSTKDYPKLPGV